MDDSGRFIFVDYSLDPHTNTVSFRYRIDMKDRKYDLTETMTLPVNLPAQDKIFGRLLRALHIALGISYYKTFMPPELVTPYTMDEGEAEFWNNVYLGGLGEFLYVNQIQQKDLARFQATVDEPAQLEMSSDWQEAALLGIGGGKDSIVAGEALKKIGMPVKGFVLGTGSNFGQAQKVAQTMGVECLGVERKLDPQLLEMNKLPGAYNGHVPISLIFALVGCLLAAAQKIRYVVVANEASASIPFLDWEDMDINHQWSKSLAFEQLFQAYVRLYIDSDIMYFSAIRPLSSVAVAKAFSKFPAYFEVFTSDNSVFKIDPAQRPAGRWSVNSPKSLSSYILFTPWMDVLTLTRIFGRNFMEEEDLKLMLLELTGTEGHRPLDCVGTTEEIVLSLNLFAKKGEISNSYLMQVARKRGIIEDKDWQPELQAALTLSPSHSLPVELAPKIQQTLTELIQ